MTTATAEARTQCAARLRILHRLPVRHERKGIRAIKIDAELLSKPTSLGQLHRNEAKISAPITFAHEATAARALDAYAVEQDQAVRRVDAARINDD